MKYENKTFKETDDIEIDGAEFIGCDLGGCRMIYRGGPPPSFVNNRGEMPQFVFVDHAANTMMLLQALSKGGFAEAVRSAFPGLYAH